MNDLQTLERVFYGRLFEVPDYQRGYAWGKQQRDDLLDDLELMADGKKHFCGTLVLHPINDGRRTVQDGNLKTYIRHRVVDGQQRLTTLIILIDALCDEKQKRPNFVPRRTRRDGLMSKSRIETASHCLG